MHRKLAHLQTPTWVKLAGRGVCWIGLAALGLGTAACGEPLATTAADCAHGELHVEQDWRPIPDDHVIVVPEALRPAVDERLRTLIASMVTGELDHAPGQDAYVAPYLRLAIITPQRALELFGCAWSVDSSEVDDACPEAGKLPFVRYRWAPYGFADEPGAFVDRVSCLADSGADGGCADQTLEDDPPFGHVSTRVHLISNLGGCLELPAAREDTDAVAQLLALGQQAAVSLDACEADYRPHAAAAECGAFFDLSADVLEPDAVQLDADGAAPCQLLETLPATGPITRCAQLEGRGRSASIENTEAGEVCEIDHALAGSPEPGFHLDADPTGAPAFPTRGGMAPPCWGFIHSGGYQLGYTADLALIPFAKYRLSCDAAWSAQERRDYCN